MVLNSLQKLSIGQTSQISYEKSFPVNQHNANKINWIFMHSDYANLQHIFQEALGANNPDSERLKQDFEHALDSIFNPCLTKLKAFQTVVQEQEATIKKQNQIISVQHATVQEQQATIAQKEFENHCLKVLIEMKDAELKEQRDASLAKIQTMPIDELMLSTINKLQCAKEPNPAMEKLVDLTKQSLKEADETSAGQNIAILTELFTEALGDKNPNTEVLTIEFNGVLGQLQGIIASQKAKIDTHDETIKAHTATLQLEINLLNKICSEKLGLEDAAAFLQAQNPYRVDINELAKIQAHHDEILSMQSPIIAAAENSVLAAGKEAKILKTAYKHEKSTAGKGGGEAKRKACALRDQSLKEYWELNIQSKRSPKHEASIMIKHEISINAKPNLTEGALVVLIRKWKKIKK